MNCLTYDQIELLLRGVQPSSPEQLAMLEHISACDACAEALALRTPELPCAAPPPGLVGLTLAKSREPRRRESLRSYSLRVLAAMAAALILLFSGAFKFLSGLPEEYPKIRQSIQTSVTSIFDFTKEGFTHASKPQ